MKIIGKTEEGFIIEASKDDVAAMEGLYAHTKRFEVGDLIWIMNSDEIINSIIKPFVVEQPYEAPGEFYISSSSNTNHRIMMNEEHYKMNTYHVGTVYILFGKKLRSDSQDIIGVYQDEKTAYHAKEYWEERFPNTFFIEKHDVWQE